MSDLSPDV